MLPERYDRELASFDKLIRGYDNTWASGDAPMMRSLFRSLSGVVKKQRSRPPVGRGLELLEQSALALRVVSKLAYDANETAQEASDAIGGDVAKIGNVEVGLIRAVMG
jgi:hypothetical protein